LTSRDAIRRRYDNDDGDDGDDGDDDDNDNDDDDTLLHLPR